MNTNQVKIGLKCYTSISGDTSVLVEVVADTKQGKKRFCLRRLDTGTMLPGLRSAGKLHAEPGPWHFNGNAKAAAPAPQSGETPIVKRGPGRPKGYSPKLKGYIVKAQTITHPTQDDLFIKLQKMPQENRKFLSDFIDSFNNVAPAIPRETLKDKRAS